MNSGNPKSHSPKVQPNRKTKKMSGASHIPKEIVFDILTRLPVKSIYRFKCVSKSWLSTISTPKFVHSHFDRSRSRPRLLISIWTTDGEENHQTLFIADREDTEQEKEGPLVLQHQATLRVAGFPKKRSLTEGGLTLSIDWDQVVITNPITKASVAFTEAFPERSDHGHHGRSVSLGFDSLNNKHKIVESLPVESMEYRVVSVSDPGNWRCVEGPAVPYYSEQEVCVDGVIYYAATDRTEDFILAFDLRSEKLQVAKLLIEGRLSHAPNSFRYIELEGKLAIVDYPYSNKVGDAGVQVPALDLWVMEDFENQVWSFKSCCLPPSFAVTRILVGTTMDGELLFVEFWYKDKPFILPGTSHYLNYIKLPEEDVSFSFYVLNIKTGIFHSREVRLPPEYPLTGGVTISAASLVERL